LGRVDLDRPAQPDAVLEGDRIALGDYVVVEVGGGRSGEGHGRIAVTGDQAVYLDGGASEGDWVQEVVAVRVSSPVDEFPNVRSKNPSVR